MEWYEALILGIVQGLTEFLPISSSGHLEIASYILKTNPSENLMFTVVVHIATAISIIYVFRKDINEIIIGLIQFKKEQVDFFIKILISSVPVGVIGVLFEKEVESFFTGNILLVGSMLLMTAALLFFTYFKKNDSKKSITYTDAIVIGLAQALAILPGISRSGSTISMALLLNVNREKATKFSFLMVLVPIFGILILKSVKGLSEISNLILFDTSYIVGFISALFSGVFACKVMLKIVKESKLIYFSAYCLIVGCIGIYFGSNKSNETFYIIPIKEISELREISKISNPPTLDSLDSHKKLLDLKKLDSEFRLDIRYASSNNFMRSKFYKNERAFFNMEAANKLIEAKDELKKLGYGIIIYDAYRPWFVTKMFWEGTPENLKHFVANPKNGSSHNKGCAIDIGLYDIKTGESVDMISGYDEFTERAYPNYMGGSKKQRDIRDMLIQVMERNDFSVYRYEWWHFDYNKCDSGIMNYSFQEIDSINS
ncbi:MAG: hypothetical protein CBE50_001045 [Flammeovirgaceae bacterium TMED290]|nr:MAG: hypothetical protein CBE50_001045 [Flammeovirgaceae bacterium TMED290]|tara:strand:+ start:2760 stop:4217 length:1458 start_codon:yes stop_codon:yes gene_type:complete